MSFLEILRQFKCTLAVLGMIVAILLASIGQFVFAFFLLLLSVLIVASVLLKSP